LIYIYRALVEISDGNPELTESLINYAYHISGIVHPAGHPFRLTLAELHQMGVTKVLQASTHLSTAYTETIWSHISRGGPCAYSATLLRIRWVAGWGWITRSVAESLVQGLTAKLDNHPYQPYHEFALKVLVKVELVQIYCGYGDFQTAKRVAAEVLATPSDILAGSPYLVSICYRALFLAESVSVQNREALFGAAQRWTVFCRDNFGLGSTWTAQALLHCESQLRNIGELYRAEQMRKILDDVLDEVCDERNSVLEYPV
jgi:hypothetical protein